MCIRQLKSNDRWNVISQGDRDSTWSARHTCTIPSEWSLRLGLPPCICSSRCRRHVPDSKAVLYRLANSRQDKMVFCKCSNRWHLSPSPDFLQWDLFHLPFPVTLAACNFSFPKTFPMIFPLPEAGYIPTPAPPPPCLYPTFPADDYAIFLIS